MSDRLQNRFKQARQSSESPIAYSGISPFALSELAQLDVSIPRSCIEGLVRARARQAHPDVAAGQEDSIRELSPYFALFKNKTLFENAITLHRAEREGLISEYESAKRNLGHQTSLLTRVSERFAAAHVHEVQDRLPLLSGKYTLVVLPDRALKDLMHNPTPEELSVALQGRGASSSFDEIPELDRNRLLSEAHEKFRADIEEEQNIYADARMKSKHTALYRKYHALIESEAPRNARNAPTMKSYEDLHGRYSSEAPLSKKLSKLICEDVIKAYKSEIEWSTDSSAIEQAKAEERDLEETERLLDLKLLVPRMEHISVWDDQAMGPSRTARCVIGALEFPHALDHRDFTSSQFFKDATGTHGADPRGLLAHFSRMKSHLSAEYLINQSPSSHPFSPAYLITAEYGVNGKVKLYVEGQIYGMIRQTEP
jgi:hypothetical protein